MARGNRSHSSPERTAEERERDREERERRRAGRSAPDPPTEMPAETPQTAEAASAEEPSIEEPSTEPLATEPLLAEEHPVEQASEDPDGREDHEDPEDHPPIAGHVLEQPPVLEDDRPPIPPLPVEVEGGPEVAPPLRTRREVPLAQRTVAAPVDEPRGRGSGRGGAGRGAGGRRGGAAGGRRLTRARGGALLALAAAVVLVWFLLSLFQPFAGSGSGRVIVQIPEGSSSSKIGSILDHEGVVSSGFFFNLRALLEGKRSSLHSGRFQLKRDMSYSAAIEALSKPPPPVITVKVVIPEGYTRRQIADLVAQDDLSGSYLAASKSSRLLNPTHYGAPAGTADLEGFLFPATYEMVAGAPVGRLVDEQLVAFRERFSPALVRRAHELHVTPYQLLTVASMIEREAQTAYDRPRIAAVIYNRLREGIPLGIDATIYYAVELQKGIATYTDELSESQLRIDSPYNTRIHKGLPPTPIANPGLASIEAAAHPSHVNYLYYVAAADGCGEQAFSSTYAEFQKNVAAYQAAVKKNGGHPPTCKHK